MTTYIIKDGNLELEEVQSQDSSGSVPIGQEVEVVTMDKSKYARIYTPTPKPSLLRRARPSISKMPKATPYTTMQSVAASSLPPASAGFIQRNTVVTLPTPPQQVQVHQTHTQNNAAVEEIVLWEPDSEECEIVEVDEAELENLFDQRQQQNNDIQQIIVCDGENVPFADFLQNYFLEVVEPPQADKQKAGRTPKPAAEKKKVTTIIKCLEEDCQGVTHNVIDLRKHLQEEHNFNFEEECMSFASDEEFKSWRTAYERDRRISFIYRGGTKKISPEKAVTYLICHRSGYYKPTVVTQSERKRKLKPQGSCKIGTHCTAGIKLLKNLTTGVVDATICHTHYGHDNENIQHLRLNSVVKSIVLEKLHEGFSFRQLLEYVHHNPDGLQGMGVVDRRAIRNIYDHWRRTNGDRVQDSEALDNSAELDKTSCPATIVKIEPDAEEDNEDAEEQEEKKSAASSEEDDKETKSGEETELDDPKKVFSKRKSKINVKSEDMDNQSNTIADEKAAISESLIKISGEILERGGKKQVKLKETKPVKIKRAKPLSSKEPPEDVHVTIEKLLKHGDSGPTVLFYKKDGKTATEYGEKTELVKKDELCIVIQTPIQRQLLQMNGKIINIEIIEGYDMDLMVLAILDEFLTSVPVAWMIVNVINQDLIEHCFRTLQKNCIEIKCQFLITAKKNEFLRLWGKVFQRLPRPILPQEDTIKEFRNVLRRYLDNREKRGDAMKQLEEMVTTPDQEIFETNLKSLRVTAGNSSDLIKIMNKDWLPIKSQWAFHKRLKIHTAVEESFMRLRKFILFKGTKKMRENIHNILKIGYDRCFQRSKSLFKGDLKNQLAVDEIQAKHGAAGLVEQVGPNKYTVDSVLEVYDLDTACTCRIRCEQCDVCVHNYWCSCGDRNFCAHAHTVRQFCAQDFVKGEEEDSDFEIVPHPSPPISDEEDVEIKEVDIDPDFDDPDVDRDADPDVDPDADPDADPPTDETEIATMTPGKCSPSELTTIDIRERPIVAASGPRVSARLRERRKSRPDDSDDEEEMAKPKKAKGRGRPRKVFIEASPRKETPGPSTRNPITNVGDSVIKKESVREDLMKLIGKLDNIHDARVMTEVKKRVSDISAVVHLGMNGQI